MEVFFVILLGGGEVSKRKPFYKNALSSSFLLESLIYKHVSLDLELSATGISENHRDLRPSRPMTRRKHTKIAFQAWQLARASMCQTALNNQICNKYSLLIDNEMDNIFIKLSFMRKLSKWHSKTQGLTRTPSSQSLLSVPWTGTWNLDHYHKLLCLWFFTLLLWCLYMWNDFYLSKVRFTGLRKPVDSNFQPSSSPFLSPLLLGLRINVC